MKHFKLLMGICIALVVISCENDNTEHIPGEIKLVKTIAGGCNQQTFASQKSAETKRDTVIFSIQHDTLSMFIGINYICCAPFVTEMSISKDTINAELIDTCNSPDDGCYCRCMCYYTWDFLFSEFEEKNYYFRIFLDDPRADGPAIFNEGTIDVTGI